MLQRIIFKSIQTISLIRDMGIPHMLLGDIFHEPGTNVLLQSYDLAICVTILSFLDSFVARYINIVTTQRISGFSWC